jgi:hypothetical protein
MRGIGYWPPLNKPRVALELGLNKTLWIAEMSGWILIPEADLGSFIDAPEADFRPVELLPPPALPVRELEGSRKTRIAEPSSNLKKLINKI